MPKIILYILFTIATTFPLQANSLEECDTLILKGIEALNKKEHVQSLKLLTDARIIAEANQYAQQLFLALNNIGSNYYALLDYGEAINHYLEAYTVALKDLDASAEMAALNNIAILYSKDKKIDKAEEYLSKAYAIAKEKGDSIKIGLYAINLAIVARESGKMKQSLEYINMALPMLGSQPIACWNGKLTKAKTLFLMNELNASEAIINELLPQLHNPILSEQHVAALLLLSMIHEQRHNMKLAEKYALQTLRDSVNIEIRIEIFVRLSELYRKNGDFDNAFRYRDAADEAKDSLSIVRNTMLFENSRIKFEVQHYQEALLRSTERLQNERKIFTIAAMFAIAMITAILLLLRFNTIKYRQRKKIAELELEKERNEKLILEKQWTENETLSLLEKEKLRNEIEAKNRKLAAKALQTASKNELTEQVLQSLLSIPEISRNSGIMRQINQLKNSLKENISESQNFLTHFEEVNSGFIAALNASHPDLTSNDLRVLSYIYMNLNSKEISSLLNITYDAYRKRKERICHKMNIADDVDLYRYLVTLS
ncbi:MAG: tetratricopeptide repeat protein [Cytophagaceae bacterium]|jgi:hypothetical protein|nr:tetratricopeptide repeat protein [Cytophagaceae bacterium]